MRPRSPIPSAGRCRGLPALAAILIVAGALPGSGAAARAQGPPDVVRLIDGQDRRGRIVALSEDGQLRFDAGGSVALDRVWRISRRVSPKPASGVVASVRLLGGGRIRATALAVEDGRVVFDWIGGEGQALPLGDVRAVRFQFATGETAPDPALFEQAAEAERAPRDKLFLAREGKLLGIDGVLEGVDAEKIRFRFNDESRTIDREKVFGLTLAVTDPPGDRVGWAGVRLADSRVRGRLVAFDGQTVSLRRDEGVTLTLPWPRVEAIDFDSARLVFLDEMEPRRQTTRAIVTYPWPMQVGRNVVGDPMRLGERTYDRGLGVHAESRLTYDLDGRFERLVATIGIDASTAEQGDCVFRVEGDRRTLLTRRVRGGDGGQTIRVDVEGVERLDLIVEPGENLDIGDRANWAEARLIRAGP